MEKKNGIPAERYYAILEWKDANLSEWQAIQGDLRVCDLSAYMLNKFYTGVVTQ